jgi:RNA polymerase sigma factor (sigma-70 family)
MASMDEEVAMLNARYRAPLMSYFLRRVKDHAESEDLTQELFLRILGRTAGPAINNSDQFIFKVAANLLRDRARRHLSHGRSHHMSLSDAGEDREDAAKLHPALVEDQEPERVLLGRESLGAVLQILDSLGERTRDIFILYRLERMKQREIAELFGLSVSSVEKHVIKATACLAEHFG